MLSFCLCVWHETSLIPQTKPLIDTVGLSSIQQIWPSAAYCRNSIYSSGLLLYKKYKETQLTKWEVHRMWGYWGKLVLSAPEQ